MARTKQTCRKSNLTPAELRQLESEVEAVHGPNAVKGPKPRRRRRV